jgi:metal-responsive CopG/Arc/MetJ family transcriptional regulator
MRTTKAISITLPEPMLAAAKKRAKKENRTMSEYIREALRNYAKETEWQEVMAQARASAHKAGYRTKADVDRAIRETRADARAEMRHKAS